MLVTRLLFILTRCSRLVVPEEPSPTIDSTALYTQVPLWYFCRKVSVQGFSLTERWVGMLHSVYTSACRHKACIQLSSLSRRTSWRLHFSSL